MAMAYLNTAKCILVVLLVIKLFILDAASQRGYSVHTGLPDKQGELSSSLLTLSSIPTSVGLRGFLSWRQRMCWCWILIWSGHP